MTSLNRAPRAIRAFVSIRQHCFTNDNIYLMPHLGSLGVQGGYYHLQNPVSWYIGVVANVGQRSRLYCIYRSISSYRYSSNLDNISNKILYLSSVKRMCGSGISSPLNFRTASLGGAPAGSDTWLPLSIRESLVPPSKVIVRELAVVGSSDTIPFSFVSKLCLDNVYVDFDSSTSCLGKSF